MPDYERGAEAMREACIVVLEDLIRDETGADDEAVVREMAVRNAVGKLRALPLPTPPAREPRAEPVPCNAHLDAEVVPGPYCPVCSYLEARRDGVDATLDAMRKRDAMKARGPEAGLVAALGNALGRHYQMTHREVVDRAARAVLKYQAEQVPARDPDEGRVRRVAGAIHGAHLAHPPDKRDGADFPYMDCARAAIAAADAAPAVAWSTEARRVVQLWRWWGAMCAELRDALNALSDAYGPMRADDEAARATTPTPSAADAGLSRAVLVDHTSNGEGRVFDKRGVRVETQRQDDGRTLKVFVTDAEQGAGREE